MLVLSMWPDSRLAPARGNTLGFMFHSSIAMTSTLRVALVCLVISGVSIPACRSSSDRTAPAPASGDASFDVVSHEYLEDLYRRSPTWATYLGIHRYDDRLEDYSHRAVIDAIAAARSSRNRLTAIDPQRLSADKHLDYEQLLRAIDSRLLTLEVGRPWATGPDSYSSGLTRSIENTSRASFARIAV